SDLRLNSMSALYDKLIKLSASLFYKFLVVW
ncbi:MAG: hypothetical protein ACI9V8_001683, partial [Urechidicola sp.]